MNNTANRLFKNMGWLYAKMGITLFLNLYTTHLVLKGLGASDFGIFNIVGGAISMLSFLYEVMSGASQRFISIALGSNNLQQVCKVFNVCVVLHAGFALFAVIVLLVGGCFFFHGILNIPEDRITAAQVVYACLIVSASFTVMTVPYNAVMNAHENMKYFAIISVFEALLKLVVAVGVGFTSSDKLIFYGSLMAGIPILNLCIMRIYCMRNYKECKVQLKEYFDRSIMKEMTGYASWNFLSSSSSLINHYGLGVVMNYFFGVLLNAAQGIASQISGMLMNLSSNAMRALNPILVKSEGAKDRTKVQYLALFGCRMSFSVISTLALPILVMTPALLRLWLDEVPIWAVEFCRLQLVRIMLEQLTSALGSAVYAQGNIRNYTISISIFNIAPIIVTPFFFYFGAEPVVLYYVWIVIRNVLGGMVLITFAWKLVGIHPYDFLRQVAFPVGIAVVSYLIPTQLAILMNCQTLTMWGICTTAYIPYFFVVWKLVLKENERNKLDDILHLTLCKMGRKKH